MTVNAGMTGVRRNPHSPGKARKPFAPTSRKGHGSYLEAADAHDRDVVFVDVIERLSTTTDVDIQHAQGVVVEGDRCRGSR